jgi:hypothetical protein
MIPNDLIQNLTADLKPVKPLPSFSVRIAILLAATITIVVLGVLYWFLRKNEFSIPEGHALVEALILFVTSIGCAALVTRSMSPHSASAAISKKPILAFLAWLLVLMGCFAMVYFHDAKEAVVALNYATWLCPTVIFSISIPIAVISLMYLLRGAVLFTRPTFFYWSLMSFSFGALGLTFICPWTDPLHELLWHLLPVTIATSLIYMLQSFIYTKIRNRNFKKIS